MATDREKILIVDDDEIQLALAKVILENEYEVVTAESGKETLDLMLHGLTPDLILLDIIMPNLDGWETFNRLKAISYLRDIPIVFLTAVTGEADVVRALKMGAADFIKKPYDKKDFLERIKKALNKNKNPAP